MVEKLEAGIFAVGMIIHVDLVEILTILGNFKKNKLGGFLIFFKANLRFLN